MVSNRKFGSGGGEFTWGPTGTRLYRWNDIGPINALSAYRRHLGQGRYRDELWLAAATGVYVSNNGAGSWVRSTPSPSHPERYAFFADLADIEAYSEIYAVGWQGIAHWSSRTTVWSVQLPSYFFNISSIFCYGGAENRSVWAVGRAGKDELGNVGDRSHGAIYHLSWPASKWKRVSLGNVVFAAGQSLNDITAFDHANVVAVGDEGLIIHGRADEDGQWEWRSIPSSTEEHLRCVNVVGSSVWIVGDKGLLLHTDGIGETWRKTVIRDDKGNTAGLRRIKFFGDTGWIVGDGLLLKSRRPF